MCDRIQLLRRTVCLGLVFFVACSTGNENVEEEPSNRTTNQSTRPNILLIVADDLGYGDIGAFGSEIDTPELDALARDGARFTRFYTQVSCSPTRALLMTGVDNHLNGLGTMAEDLLPHHDGVPGYEGYLNDRVVTGAQLLKDAGYHTYLTGKWHLGLTPDKYPSQRGFERTYASLVGNVNHFNDRYIEDGKVVDGNGFSSDLFTDKLIEAIESNHGDGRPFFGALLFTAPHWPLQAPTPLIEKYLNRYVDGWDVTRQGRFERLKEMGLVPADMGLPPRIEEVPDWSDLTDKERQIETKKMAIHAAMVDNLDTNVGRILELLEKLGESENTLVVFMSDNGTDPYDRSQRPMYVARRAELGLNTSFEDMGTDKSYVFYGLGWAQVGSVHHRHYKFLPSEGGMHAPMIARFPGVLTPGDDLDSFASVVDITPTFLDVANVEHPGTEYGGREIYPMRGRSLLPYMSDSLNVPYGDDDPVAFEIYGHKVVFMGPWKAVQLRQPWDESIWRLYNLNLDPGEQQDLAHDEPELLMTLIEAYERFSEENGVVDEPADVPPFPYKPGHLGDLITEP